MTWNFHQYYTNRSEGLIGQLLLTEQESQALKALRQKVRIRTRDIFDEAKNLVRQTKSEIGFESLNEQILGTRFRHLSPSDRELFAELIMELNEDARAAFLKLSPRFWTQGSFTYDTLNKPYKTPPQEMDIDDGTYLPMVFFDEKPVIGHQLLVLLVDTSLKSLVAENKGWQFEAKRTCGRLKIPNKDVHIDVPMYAIPEDKFLERERVIKESFNARASLEGFDSIAVQDSKIYELDSDCVNLAVRAHDQKWMKSDPKVVDDWFRESCGRIGIHLRKICRILKAWRDAQWQNGGGPSSISLMAATVDILNHKYVDTKDFGSTMLTIAKELPTTFRNGVESPDESDERPLFLHESEHTEKENEIVEKMEQLAASLESALNAETREKALNILNLNFGQRVTNASLIVSIAAAPAFASEPKKATEKVTISPTMRSG